MTGSWRNRRTCGESNTSEAFFFFFFFQIFTKLNYSWDIGLNHGWIIMVISWKFKLDIDILCASSCPSYTAIIRMDALKIKFPLIYEIYVCCLLQILGYDDWVLSYCIRQFWSRKLSVSWATSMILLYPFSPYPTQWIGPIPSNAHIFLSPITQEAICIEWIT